MSRRKKIMYILILIIFCICAYLMKYKLLSKEMKETGLNNHLVHKFTQQLVISSAFVPDVKTNKKTELF